MNATHALATVKALADGIDPLSGTAFPEDSPYQRGEIVRALCYAVRALESTVTSGTPGTPDADAPDTPAMFGASGASHLTSLSDQDTPAQRSQTTQASESGSGRTARSAARPANAGKPWSPAEDEALLVRFDTGQPIAELARTNERSRFAIEARLAKFGRVPMPNGVRTNKTSF